jgi:hypothetical protein
MRLLCALVMTLLLLRGAAAGESVLIENASRPTRCAEEDNIYVKFVAAGIRRFTIEATHPAYLAAMGEDSMAPDFADCDMSHEPSIPATPKDVVLFEDAEYRLVGHSFASFWRPAEASFRVGNAVTENLHLIQLLRKLPGRAIEILVLYPADGYWRLKPLPPAGLAETGYGSSFLIGPIEEAGRPFVRLRSIAFDRATLAFHLAFLSGDGELRVVEATPDRTRLAVILPPLTDARPFAALRSMFVSNEVADAAEARLSPPAGPATPWPILDFPPIEVRAAEFARGVPSRHNRSAPDLRFADFGR